MDQAIQFYKVSATIYIELNNNHETPNQSL